eukprot:SAG11_NODE_626_length_8100_cov_5.500875_2_plen_226_part_00
MWCVWCACVRVRACVCACRRWAEKLLSGDTNSRTQVRASAPPQECVNKEFEQALTDMSMKVGDEDVKKLQEQMCNDITTLRKMTDEHFQQLGIDPDDARDRYEDEVRKMQMKTEATAMTAALRDELTRWRIDEDIVELLCNATPPLTRKLLRDYAKDDTLAQRIQGMKLQQKMKLQERVQEETTQLEGLEGRFEIGFTQQGRAYYINHDKKSTQWNDPRVANYAN